VAALRPSTTGFAAVVVLLAGCSTPPPDIVKPEVTAPAVLLPTPPAPRAVVRTNWTFTSGADECVAVAAGEGTSLRVTVRRDAPISLDLSLATFLQRRLAAHAAIPLRFAGSAGRWQVSARQTASRQLAVTLGSGDSALSRVLVLLSGGAMDVENPERVVLSLIIPPSDAPGQLWFDCARGKMM
jgi:hypothetical protein